MKKQIFTTILLWALAQVYLILGFCFVQNNFMFSEWTHLSRYLLFLMSSVVTYGFISLFSNRK